MSHWDIQNLNQTVVILIALLHLSYITHEARDLSKNALQLAKD